MKWIECDDQEPEGCNLRAKSFVRQYQRRRTNRSNEDHQYCPAGRHELQRVMTKGLGEQDQRVAPLIPDLAGCVARIRVIFQREGSGSGSHGGHIRMHVLFGVLDLAIGGRVIEVCTPVQPRRLIGGNEAVQLQTSW